MTHSRWILCACLAASLAQPALSKKKKEKPPEPTPLDRYVAESLSHSQAPSPTATSAGSLWSAASRLTDLGSDIRARLVDDMVTILVSEKASAVTTGATKTQRQSQIAASINAAGGITRATGPWANLAKTSNNTQLDGSGTTSRETTLTTTLGARVTHVLPNGYLVVEGNKELTINSERQVITVRGVVRPEDLTTGNIVPSDHVAQLEIRVNGKGVVGDAIRRPNFLYRLLLGILPF